ncbi:MAG: hypothetical protein EZS28_020536 [Streblomastix strix]|uniref:Uncharacterized protein n=1 Tax=Streblomastix strix TaxID=222440 RepID=A0A5J4VNT6_9EUKA|nr:MAG: hypothetical protein EZS28_020536 [Streblomastix strix]
MEKSREQGNISVAEESNLFQWERGTGRVTGLVNKGRVRIKNNQSDQLTINLIMEQNICNKETGRRIEENNGLLTVEHTAKILAFYNERPEQGIGNMEVKRLGMSDGHQISVQSCDSNWRIGEIPRIYTQRSSLYASENTFRDLNNTGNLCKDNQNKNGWSEKLVSSKNYQQLNRHSVSDAGSTQVEERNRVANRGVQEIWMGDQRVYEQAEAQIAIYVHEMLKKIAVRENEFGESEKLLERGPMMRRRILKVPLGKILALEVNGDKMEQVYFEMSWELPDYQEMQLKQQQLAGMEVREGMQARYQPFGSI